MVDDEPNNIALLEAVLQGEGYDTLSAQNGSEAIDKAKSEIPDLILMDIMMPGIDGFQACENLKSDSTTTDIPVIFISADQGTDSKVKGLDIGAVDYITKPFKKGEVLARVRLQLKLSISNKAVIAEQTQKLEKLHDAQQAILISPEDLPEAKFGVRYCPYHEAGGDFYDVVSISDDIFGYFVADTSGHDVAASFTTPALKVLLSQYVIPVYTPTETMKNINSVLNTMMADGKHVTACYANLNRRKRQLQIISAGHPPVIYLAANGRPQHFELKGDVLGAFERVCFETLRQAVSEGDRFFIYSDGLIEQTGQSLQCRQEGIKKLSQACFEHQQLPIDEAVDRICEDIVPNGSDPKDDIVLLGVEV